MICKDEVGLWVEDSQDPIAKNYFTCIVKIQEVTMEHSLHMYEEDESSWDLACREKHLRIGERTLVMGIINTTPDSFSDGGETATVEAAVERAWKMVESGADLLDIGGESTRPGSTKVQLEEELRRVIPVIQAISRSSLDVPISVDTYKAEVARHALEAGAHIVNDIWGLKRDRQMAGVVSQYRCPVILMHNRENRNYGDFMKDVISDLRESIQLAHEAGIGNEQLMIDPGIGFAKDTGASLWMMGHLSEIVALGYPVVLGPQCNPP